MTMTEPTTATLTPTMVLVLAALHAADGPRNSQQLARWITERFGERPARATMSTALNKLATLNLAVHYDIGGGRQRMWRRTVETP